MERQNNFLIIVTIIKQTLSQKINVVIMVWIQQLVRGSCIRTTSYIDEKVRPVAWTVV